MLFASLIIEKSKAEEGWFDVLCVAALEESCVLFETPSILFLAYEKFRFREAEGLFEILRVAALEGSCALLEALSFFLLNRKNSRGGGVVCDFASSCIRWRGLVFSFKLPH